MKNEEIKKEQVTKNEEQEVRQEEKKHENHENRKHDHRRGRKGKKNWMDGAKKVGKRVVTALTVVGGITVLGLIGMAVATAGQNKKKNKKSVEENGDILYLVAENADEDDREEKDDDDPFKNLEKQMENSETK